MDCMTRSLATTLAAALSVVLASCATTPAPTTAPARAAVPVASAQPARLATSDGVGLAYEVAGRGAPAVFVHGGPGSGSHAFRLLSNGTLEKHFRIAWLDQRGSGASASDPKGDYSLERQVADLEELRIALGWSAGRWWPIPSEA